MRRAKRTQRLWLPTVLILAWTLSAFFPAAVCRGADSVCAEVKIEVAQDLTLERQAFDAHMRINNGLTHISLEDVAVSVWFRDAAGNVVEASSDASDTTALFFIRVDEMTNIEDVDGSGTVASSTAADIHWLIIPAAGASNGLENGTLYYVGATLSYTIGGQENQTTVSPDYIYVKPLPQLLLDYFLPAEVYGDDAFTAEVEDPVPFTLGVRVKNSGQGTARALTIDSAQPKITDNEQGLLVGFTILDGYVNGESAGQSLLVDFGDIAPGAVGTARWRMTCPLSGKFKSFEADFTHSDELGGALTSLISAAETHILVRDVRVDLSGRDRIADYLALDGDVYRVYESDNLETEVADQSASSSLTQVAVQDDKVTCRLDTTAGDGFIFARLADPYSGAKVIDSAVRSDGKTIKDENVWLSKSRNGEGWNYFVNLFDVSGTGRYSVVFSDPVAQNHAPVLAAVDSLVAVEADPITLTVTASDPDGTVPVLSAASLPAGAVFTDQGSGTGLLAWTPAVGQAGSYSIIFKASDGILSDSKPVDFTIRSVDDIDGDTLADAWELAQFGSLERDGSGDFDNDGISDLDEYLMGTDPTAVDHAPTAPVVVAPVQGATVNSATPTLEIENSTDADGDTLYYQFEVFADEGLDQPVAVAEGVAQTEGTTAWTTTAALEENRRYYWRVRATDGYSYSLWAYGEFFVDTENEPPAMPAASYPIDGDRVGTTTPVLAALGFYDPDGEVPGCTFEIYADQAMTSEVAVASGLTVSALGRADWAVDDGLADGATYYWRAVATDAHGLSQVSALSAFTVDTGNRTPGAPALSGPADGEQIDAGQVDLTVVNASDADGNALGYYFEIDTDPGFGGDTAQTSGFVAAGMDTTAWTVSGLVENTCYYWRVRASDGNASSRWTYGRFFASTQNEAPLAPAAKNPGQSAWVGVLTPTLSLAGALDPEGDAMSYAYEVFADAALSTLVASATAVNAAWTVDTELCDKTRYYWRARATDAHGLDGAWMEASSFFVSREAAEPSEVLTVTVATGAGDPLCGLRVYAYKVSGAYAGLYDTTDSDGVVAFAAEHLEEGGSYLFRVDYLGIRFWSETVTFPDSAEVAVLIDLQSVAITVDSAAGTLSGVRVYLYSASGAYLGQYQNSDEDGRVSFTLPVGATFIFRADVLGTSYWSGAVSVAADGPTVASVDAGGGTLQVRVVRDDQSPMQGLRVYLFDANGGAYRGVYGTTGEDGAVTFDVTEAAYSLRVDYLGYKFWSDPVTMVTDTTETIAIAHQTARLTVQGCYGESEEAFGGIPVYLFTPAGSYLGQRATTDEDGQVAFDLPEEAYMIRADYLGGKFWSEAFTWKDPVISIAQGDARITVAGAGLPTAGVTVYAFSASGAYLGLSTTTDEDGQASFRLPEGTYQFRADYQGSQFWARDQWIGADTVTDVAISVGGGTFALSLVTGDQVPMSGVKCHVFSETGAHLGLSGVTDETGTVFFDLADNTYLFRVDYLGHQFWSDAVAVTAAATHEMAIDHSAVTVALTAAGAPVSGAKVYLFSTAGAYLGTCAVTGDDGLVAFDLPVGIEVRFRADLLSKAFWSADVAVSDSDCQVAIDAGGGRMTVTVQTDFGAPMAGLTACLFDEDNRYLGLSAICDEAGRVAFDVPEGVYRVRVGYLGYYFWQEGISVVSDLDVTLTIALQTITVTVAGAYQSTDTPLAGLTVYLYTPTGSYLGFSGQTDDQGQVIFDLPEKSYMVRVDYTGGHYWSEPFTWQDPTVAIPMADAVVSVTGAGLPTAGVNVYLFSIADAYLGQVQATDENGTVRFHLPAGTFRFRADYQANHYWSADASLVADVENAVLIGVGGGRFALSVQTGGGSPMAGINTYVFSETGTYLGLKGGTDTDGRVCFDLADGTFRFRADHLGCQFWSDAVGVPGTLAQTVAIGHSDVALTFQADYLDTIEPLEGRRVYLFTPAGSYLGRYQETGADGQTVFSLPDQPYKLRCDELGQQYWSDTIQSTDTTVTVRQGKAIVQVTSVGIAAPNARVYLFSATDSYLGRYENTDATGTAEFLLPAGQYRFRADLEGRQQWTAVIDITADMTTTLTVDLE